MRGPREVWALQSGVQPLFLFGSRQNHETVSLIPARAPAKFAFHDLPIFVRLLAKNCPAYGRNHKVCKLKSSDVKPLVLQSKVDNSVTDPASASVVGSAS